ncbi:MAG TPA: ABC transporter permease [Cellvibrionaceae bacterium]
MLSVDSLQEIAHTLKQNKLRTLLTAFGVFWGILMLILLLGAGKGMQNGMESMFSSDLRDSIWINPRQTSLPYKGLSPGRTIQLTEQDIKAIREKIPNVQFLSAENPLGSARQADVVISYQNKTGSFGVMGVADGYFKIKAYQDYQQGRRLNELDQSEERKVTVIGTRVYEKLFAKNEDPIGKIININGVTYKVVGVFYDSGWEGRMSERAYVPLSGFQKTFGKGDQISIIALSPKPGADGFAVEEQVVNLLKERHKVAPDDKKAIFSWNLAKQTQQFSQMFAAIDAFIWFVGIGTLMAGIVGISNIMLITVKERTVEIGVRKALGATPRQIVGTLLLESVLVTSIAGYLGLVLGVGLLEAVSYLLTSFNIKLQFFSRPEVDFAIAIKAIILLVAIGAFAGFLPAWRAAKISPIEAMRAAK